jgi:uncharacterized cupredoxin-like copper-binding protein
MPGSLHRPLALAVSLASAVGVVLLTGGCGGTSAPASDGGSVVPITERDFHISAPSRVPAGHVVFRVHNLGPDDHEFIVVRTDGHPLPLRSDGMTVSEESLQSSIVGSLEPGPPGSVRYLKLDLPPGRYEVLCNMEGHYMGGMHDDFVAGS